MRDRAIRLVKNNSIMTAVVVGTALLTLMTTLVKFSDAFDYFIERARPIREIREKAIVQDGKIDGIALKVDDVKQDTKAILRELRRR